MIPDLTIARQCLKFASRVYAEAEIDEVYTSTQVLFGGWVEHPHKLIIAFRGTREPRDYLTDTKFWFKGRWINQPTHGAKIHRGVRGAYLSVQERIHARAWHAKEIYVIGHSLGGMKAQVCALDLFEAKFPVAGVHVFGCPRVGNGAFRDWYNANLHSITLRWEAEGDPVPWMPPLLNNYRHAGRAAYLKNDGRVIIEPTLIDHVPAFVETLARPMVKRDVSGIFGLFDPHALTNYEKLFEQLKEAA